MITYPNIESYVEGLVSERSPVLQRMEREAAEEGIPIIVLPTVQFLRVLLKMIRPARILEIGSAIGYSAIHMAEAVPSAEIVTIEIDEERAARAQHNFREAGVAGRIHLLLGDALEWIPKQNSFDFVFIDAAKGKYEEFLQLALDKLSSGGTILSDNVLFRGLVAEEKEQIEPRFRSMVSKLQRFNVLLASNPQLDTTFLSVGDGLALSRRK